MSDALPTQPGKPGDTPPAPAAGAPPAGDPQPKPTDTKTFTQADVDRPLAEEKRQAKDAGLKAGRQALLGERKSDFEELEAQRAAKLTEAEKQAKELEDARKVAADEKARADALQIQGLRSDLIMEKAPDLPLAYKRLVDGDTPEAVEASIAKAHEAWDSELKDTFATLGAELQGMPPEKIAEEYGEQWTWLAELKAGRPLSVGAPTNAPPSAEQQRLMAPPVWNQAAEGPPDLKAWEAERERRGFVPLR